MKLTLLDIVQNILSTLDSDEVNSIGDTVEARQVANIVKSTYMNLINRMDLPNHRQVFSLDTGGDSSAPVLMIRPSNVVRIDWIKYDWRQATTDSPQYRYVTMLPFAQYSDMTHQMSPTTDSSVDSFTLNDHVFNFKNNAAPMYCTVVNDQYIIFDAFDSAVDSVLQPSKTLCYGLVGPTFEMRDEFIPDLDDKQFALLLNEAKSWAFMELKQVAHEKAERESRRQWVTLQRKKHLEKLSDFDQLPNFGRPAHFRQTKVIM